MFNNNRHLNIFEHYTQKGALPIENNISSGLAILLNENHLFLDRFIDYVNAKCQEKKSGCIVPKPQKQEDKEIGIQQQISKIVDSYPDPQTVIGITLTTAAPVDIIENKKDNNHQLITDIVISCKDTLVVIEVKRNASDARMQLKQQVDSIISVVERKGGNVPDRELLDGSWEEVIAVLQDVHSLTGSNHNTILAHYISHLENNYQAWFPVARLSDLEITKANEAAIDKRILKLTQNCCENDDDTMKYAGRIIVPLDCDFASEAQIAMDYDSKRLMITIWSGDTKWQGDCLLNKTINDFSWIYADSLTVEGHALDLVTEPYLRLAHFQSSIFHEYFLMDYYEQHYGSSKDQCRDLFRNITKQWKRHNWDELKQLFKTTYSGLIDVSSFDASFANHFEDSNRSYAQVSFGYETTAYIPLDVFNKFEKMSSTSRDGDRLAAFISKAVQQLIDTIK
ncbi:hypothetical protein PAECIP111893_02343 [Paenibacillus plantiphilus]|uniref:PD-(D/E)XK nuclease superfamily protein n=1 Tax=Paenibacillus plantiphilus TaxID=2905650 RepID=A0ABM9C8C5_9BACL|nr:hypothetical protein [Paenibacillus plantiphilus]CAH1205413.1 hypothetical protein PAECIP111893_02343 [Paenibacillus plantiphilus]